MAPLVTNLRNSVRLPVKSTRVGGSGGGKGSEPTGAHCMSFTAATSGGGPGSVKLLDQRLVDPQDGRVRFSSIPVDFWHDSTAEGVREITLLDQWPRSPDGAQRNPGQRQWRTDPGFRSAPSGLHHTHWQNSPLLRRRQPAV